MPGMAFLQAAGSPAAARPPKRSRAEAPPGSKTLEEQVQELSKQLQKVCQVVVSHDANLRELDAWSTKTWLLDPQSDLATQLMGQMESWKSQLQQGQAHPLGPSRLIVAATVAKWVLSGPDRKAGCPTFSLFHDKMEALDDLKSSVQLAFAKTIKDGRVLLKIRPNMDTQSQWAEVFALLDGAEFSESKDVAPPGNFIRELRNKGR